MKTIKCDKPIKEPETEQTAGQKIEYCNRFIVEWKQWRGETEQKFN